MTSIGESLSIEERLGINCLPSYEEALNSKEKLKDICCAFYNCEREKISDIWLDPFWRDYNRVRFVHINFCNKKEDSFVLKKSWEGAMTEALGMTLANILIDESYRFIVSDKEDNDIIAMNRVKGKELDNVGEDEFNEKCAKSYGIAVELANAIVFGDRGYRHIILTDNDKVVHIDFGCIFSNFNRNFEIPSIHSSKYGNAIDEGKRCGKRIIKQNFERNKPLLKQIIRKAKKRGAFKKNSFFHYKKNPLKIIKAYINSS